MERAAGWRPIEPQDEPDDSPEANTGRSGEPRSDGLRTGLAAVLGAGVLIAAGILLWAGTPQPQIVLGPSGQDPSITVAGDTAGGTAGDSRPTALPSMAPELIVDVQGAVVRPGLQRLATGARVGDAIAAAGGYGPQVDIRATAERLNLAERLVDGAKVYVPARGDPTPQVASAGDPALGSPAGPGAGGLIDVNTAGQAQLETLPGIGPVTAGKIISARQEQPFASADDLLARKVVGPATFEKIKPLITVSP
jgi:competence protein ComEA